MPTQVKVQTPEGVRTIALSDVRPYWLYDTATIATADTEHYFFRTPENKTLVDTNLRQFSTIQVGWTFDISTIRVVPRVAIPIADMEILFANTVTTFLREGDIEIFTLPTVMLNAGCGLFGATTNTAEDIVSLGIPASGAVMKLKWPIVLYGGETFQFRTQWNPAVSASLSASAKVYMVLEGTLKRGVRGA